MSELRDILDLRLAEAGVVAVDVQDRTFPGERWLIVYVHANVLVAAQSLAGEIESAINEGRGDEDAIVVAFRPERQTSEQSPDARVGKGQLHAQKVDQLIQLLEARSRTSDALPSLKYVEDPRASLAAVGASRHQLIYGRRGVGKTALLLEAKRQAEREGHVAVWLNAHLLRDLSPESAFIVLAESAVESLIRNAGSSTGSSIQKLAETGERLSKLSRGPESGLGSRVAKEMPKLNKSLRAVLRDGLFRLYIFVDDFYLLPIKHQPRVLDLMLGAFRDCNGWLKIASIERLTRPYEPSTRVGMEVPHDATKIDLDVTLEDPSAAQHFLESVLDDYVRSVNIRGASSIAKPDARGRLVLASGGVPRDYLNLFASSIVVARNERAQAKQIGKEDVAQAAGQSARSKKRDLEQDVASDFSGSLLEAQVRLASDVKGEGFTYFRVDFAQKTERTYELLAQLVDLRFAHLVASGLSDQHRAGTKYEVYVLDLSEFSDVRLKRGLNVLDLEAGKWKWRLTGKARTVKALTGTQFRDHLRQAPLFDLDRLADLVAPVSPRSLRTVRPRN